MDEQRLMRLPISDSQMLSLLQGKVAFTNLDLPTDVRIVQVSHDLMLNGWQILLASATFERVPFGQQIPLLPPQYLKMRRTAE